MNAVIAEESVTRGWLAGTFAGVGAMLADIVFFLLAMLGVATIIENLGQLESVLYVLGGLLMLVFAVDAARATLSSTAYTDIDTDRTATGFRKALVLGLTNPFQLAFWVTVGVALVRPGTIDLGEHTQLLGTFVIETGSISLLGGFFGGIVAWIIIYPVTVGAIGERIDAAGPVIAAISAIILAAFGAIFLWLGLSAFV